jgi:FlaA1/EpsC-like NDP-sugar epimerase
VFDRKTHRAPRIQARDSTVFCFCGDFTIILLKRKFLPAMCQLGMVVQAGRHHKRSPILEQAIDHRTEFPAEFQTEFQNEIPQDWSVFLQRTPFTCDRLEYNHFFLKKTVLITGAGGSIGTCLARMLMRGTAQRLVLLDHSRRNLLALRDLLQRHSSVELSLDAPRTSWIEGSILDEALLGKVFSAYRPNIVFHAAALKHLVPLEDDPFSALETNTFGTSLLESISSQWGAEQLVNVSTDKAVNPSSILGASKRIAELVLLSSRQSSCTRHSLRLGNVLGSSGSVVPIFQQALRSHLPLRVTQPDALRYFVTMEEAAGFLAQSLALKESSLLLPEMGAPKRICDLADFLSGQKKNASPLVCTGLRDGEKHSEELTYGFEYLRASRAPHLYKICGNAIEQEDFTDHLTHLRTALTGRRPAEMLRRLLAMVPEFTPSPTLLRHSC